MRIVSRKTFEDFASRPQLSLGTVLLLLLATALAALLWSGSGPAEGAVILGKEELVELSSGEETVEVLAKIDTGAGYSSIDEDLAEDLRIDLEDPEDEVRIESANGDEMRPLVWVHVRVAGETLNTRVTVADRSELSKDVLLGSRDLEGFLLKPNAERLTSPGDPEP